MKIADFGISKMMEKGKKYSKIGGTRMFLPPETWLQKSFDGEPVDIWALGITFYYLAFEYYPFQSVEAHKFNKIIEETEVKYPESADPVYVKMLKRMIVKDPKQRCTLYDLFDDEWVVKDEEEPLEKLEGHEVLVVSEEEARNALTRRKIEINMFAFSKMKTKLFRNRTRSKIPDDNSESKKG